MANSESQRTTRGTAQDRKRVAGKQYYETNYIARKFRVPVSRIEEAIQKVGNDRQKIEQHIRQGSKKGK